MCFKQEAVPTLNRKPLKSIEQFKYLGRNISSTKNDVNMCRGKVWTAVDRLSIIWNSNLCEKKIGFRPGCGRDGTTIWTHYLHFYEKYEEKVRWVLDKNDKCCFEEILESAP